MISSGLESGVLELRLARPERRNALADDALTRAPQSYGLTKRLLLVAASSDLESGLVAETIAQSLLVGTADHAEGVQAAREGRPPSFTGR